MKLIDILVEELPKRGGWPKGADYVVQDNDGSLDVKFGAGEATLEHDKRGVWANDITLDWGINTCESYIRDFNILACDAAVAIITREQYEAALAAKSDGWISWGGGECPVPGDTEVLIKCKSEGAWGYRHKQRADEVSWTHDDSMLDVIAYRLHKQKEVEQDKANLNECIGHDSSTVWSGIWLPSAGCECEYQYKVHGSEWCSFECVAIDGNAAFGWGNNTPIALQLNTHNFRPIRSESDKKRDEAKLAIAELCRSSVSNGHAADLIYDAIAAGKIPCVKLED